MGINAKPGPTVGEKAAATPAVAPGTRPRPARRGDPRAARTIDKILASAIDVMLDRGASKLACSDVCERAGVSRATFYRYYASKEALLEAVSLHIRTQTHLMLDQSIAGHDDPAARWNAIVDNPDIATQQAARLLEKEPSFTIAFAKDGFETFKARLVEALSPVFDAWEAELDGGLNRQLLAELMIRYSTSELILPAQRSRAEVVAELGKMLALLRRRPE